jgi:hypothetical protein
MSMEAGLTVGLHCSSSDPGVATGESRSRHHLGEAIGSVELEALIRVLAPDPGARAAAGRDPRSPTTLATRDTELPWVAEPTR